MSGGGVKAEKVGIFITTNIDDKIHGLTKSMLYNPLLRSSSRHYSKYPLTTNETTIDYDELKFKKYEQIVDFFFDINLFSKQTGATKTIAPTATSSPTQIQMDASMTDVDKKMTRDMNDRMITSRKGTSPLLQDVSAAIQILNDDIFGDYNAGLKDFIARIERGNSVEYENIKKMLNNEMKQNDADNIDTITKTKMTDIKKELLRQIEQTRNKIITDLSLAGSINVLKNINVRKKHDQTVKNTNLNTNINIMLYRLFPKTNLSASTFMSSVVRKIFPLKMMFKYSYLKIDGQVYTVVQYNWLKMMINHPLYRRLFDEMVKFIDWTDEQTTLASSYIQETDENISAIIPKCSGDEIYTDNGAVYNELQQKLKNYKVGRANTDTEYISAVQQMASLLDALHNNDNNKILNLLSQFAAYKQAREVINLITVKPLRQNIQKMLEFNVIKDEIEFYIERFFSGSQIDLKYQFPSYLASRIDNEPIKRLQKMINDEFLPSIRTSTNYEFQSKFEQYLNKNGTAFIEYIKNQRKMMGDFQRPPADANC
jgi:hypothetical protein